MTVGELRSRMGAAEFAQWRAYSRIEPFGDRRADARTWALIGHVSNVLATKPQDRVDLTTILPEWRAAEDPLVTAHRIKLAIETEIERGRMARGET